MSYYPHSSKIFRKTINKNYPEAKSKEGLNNVPSHLLWMLDGIEKMKDDSQKAARWLGYVIGRLEALNLLNNKESRDIVKQDVSKQLD
jgi:hypothetical protein